jgi:hypothetical protein
VETGGYLYLVLVRAEREGPVKIIMIAKMVIFGVKQMGS